MMETASLDSRRKGRSVRKKKKKLESGTVKNQFDSEAEVMFEPARRLETRLVDDFSTTTFMRYEFECERFFATQAPPATRPPNDFCEPILAEEEAQPVRADPAPTCSRWGAAAFLFCI
mmetsp:Transcript_3502/g.11487  ORF Transcript_3502/g.11487 Transcript_3502/m.11487 type:complete len:118 (-) Transcript_3502:832-1185(-)